MLTEIIEIPAQEIIKETPPTKIKTRCVFSPHEVDDGLRILIVSCPLVGKESEKIE
jgi:hypothetical protein